MRVCVLAVFSIISFTIGLTWTTFSSVPDVAAALFPALSPASLTWTLNANNLSQLLTAPFAIYLLARPPIGRTGLRLTVLLGTFFLLVQSLLWAIATLDPSAPWVVALLIMGGTAGGSASAFTQGCVSHLSAAWFPPKTRGTVTSVAYASQYAGQALAYLTALPICTAADLATLLRIEAAIAIGLMIAALAFPDGPARERLAHVSTANSEPEVEETHDGTTGRAAHALSEPLCQSTSTSPPCPSRLERLLPLCTALEPGQARTCALVGIYAAWLNGFYSGWATTLPLMWPATPTAALSAGTSACATSGWKRAVTHPGNLLGFVAGVAYPLGGALAGVIADRYFVHQLRRFLLACMALAFLAFAVIVACRPPLTWLPPSNASTNHTHGGADEGVLITFLPSVFVGGAVLGATMPTAMELLAEVGFPIPPGASANAVVALLQISATVITSLVAILSPEAMNALMLLAIGLCTLLLLPVQERYRRCESERLSARR